MFTHLWHTILDMDKESEAWHLQDIQDELEEYHEAKGIVPTWSEISDIVYTHTRAQWTGYKHFIFPLPWYQYAIGWLYMFPKYTLRWSFFWVAARLTDKNIRMRELRNPKKVEKLYGLAEKYRMDDKTKEIFVGKCKRLLKYWPLLK